MLARGCIALLHSWIEHGWGAFAVVWLVCIAKDLMQYGDVGPLWGVNLALAFGAALLAMACAAAVNYPRRNSAIDVGAAISSADDMRR